ncbi:hypothetical protein Q7378_09665 [Glaesserella parasuis]|uniref:hypothetical protein n=1 Tax=Glaesserella parasuis TaxID=738 RepID=UPI000DD4E22B|nr:hypothetical protein [Glaesserella parasuis]MDG6280438.1 hypothetical protein [Glaesserella parasuis]MDG6282371.1 hypothetical protein [Glaesserella parasuis]MDG6284316.1 hypothetical protein [Glaesserella parasuis]MDG6324390.1 hypothetical protein [Glaesserella parasuis]MDO9924964.1 hypothetical protein [Glaesserella parasuis]
MSNEHIFSEQAVAEMQKVQNSTALAAKAMTQDLAEAYEMLGMVKMSDFHRKLTTCQHIKVLAEFKESKKYKGLEMLDVTGNRRHVSTWDDFCSALGFSRQKIDEDISNLSKLGEDFLETSQRLGLGYREMRKLRQLPEDARAEIVEADYSEATDKEELIEKIEDLTAKHAKEKAELEAKLKRKSDDYDAQAKVLANKNAQIDRLDTELAKKTKAIETQTPDQRGGLLREETTQISYKAEAILRGQVWQAFEALAKHSEETGIDHRQFMSGVLAEYQLILSELQQHFQLDDSPSGSDLPEWARDDTE